jgi:hypothetical protein
MELLSQIEEREARARDRAWRFEKLTYEIDHLKGRVESLSRPGPADAVNLLRRLTNLSNIVPESLMTRGRTTGYGGVLVPGGYVVRDLLKMIAEDALDDIQRRAEHDAESLVLAQKKLSEAQAALAALERGS